jgi:hypothetical protein
MNSALEAYLKLDQKEENKQTYGFSVGPQRRDPFASK